MKDKVKIIIVDDHSITLNGIKAIVEKVKMVDIVGSASSGREALALLGIYKVDIIITDVEMNDIDGIELTKIVRKKYPSVKMIAVTQHSERWIIDKLLKLDIDAIILKSKTDCNEINVAIRSVLIANKYYSTEIKDSFFSSKTNNADIPNITPREKQILRLICKEYTSQKISTKLHIAESTVESHRKNLFIKLKVKSQSGLVREAIRLGVYKFS